MSNLTKNEVILQLANLASGIERTTGDSLKAKALRKAIEILDTAPKTDAEKRYNIHGCGSANEVIKNLQQRNSELDKECERLATWASSLANNDAEVAHKAFVKGFMCGYNQEECLVNPESESVELAEKYAEEIRNRKEDAK